MPILSKHFSLPALLAIALVATQVASAAAAKPDSLKSATSQAKQVESSPEVRIRAAFAKSFPSVRITSVGPTPWQGVYEAVTPEGIIYADATGQFAMNGKMVDVPTQENLTDTRMADLNRIDFGSLPFERAIKSVKGDGSRKLAVFADPDCPYCRRLETEIKDLNNVTIYTFLYPIDQLHPDATKHAKQIWCAKDPAATWQAWLVNQVEPPAASCEGDPVAELSVLGDRLQIVGTPTIFLADGHRIPGFVPLAAIEQALGSVSVN